MTRLLPAFFSWLGAFFRSRNDLGLELVALRHQLAILKRQKPRPKLSRSDRLFWLTLRRLGPKWSTVLLIVNPETVVRWHRAGFRWQQRRASGRGSYTSCGRPPVIAMMQATDARYAHDSGRIGLPPLENTPGGRLFVQGTMNAILVTVLEVLPS